MTKLSGALLEGVVDRLTRSDYRAFDAQLRSSGFCARPVRLRGHVEVCDGHGGRQRVWSTDGTPVPACFAQQLVGLAPGPEARQA